MAINRTIRDPTDIVHKVIVPHIEMSPSQKKVDFSVGIASVRRHGGARTFCHWEPASFHLVCIVATLAHARAHGKKVGHSRATVVCNGGVIQI